MDAVKRFGTSCTGSRFLNGNLGLHQELETQLADYVGKEAALVFSTGFQVNLGTISCLVQKGDVVIADKDDHASIVDGCLLALGEMRRFNHNDLPTWSACSKASSRVLAHGGGGRGLQHGGRSAPLPEMVPICKSMAPA